MTSNRSMCLTILWGSLFTMLSSRHELSASSKITGLTGWLDAYQSTSPQLNPDFLSTSLTYWKSTSFLSLTYMCKGSATSCSTNSCIKWKSGPKHQQLRSALAWLTTLFLRTCVARIALRRNGERYILRRGEAPKPEHTAKKTGLTPKITRKLNTIYHSSWHCWLPSKDPSITLKPNLPSYKNHELIKRLPSAFHHKFPRLKQPRSDI
jgi:hypothetical protein